MTAALVSAAPRQAGPAARELRTDIQGLRALAVSLVVIYHLWPHGLRGGFVGVDVFLVISGFLITSHLWSHPPRRAIDLAAFWARRVRRLLPASLLVLAVTLVAARLVAPETRWAGTAVEAMSAALYVENWRLAATSVDYLAAENAPSPVQHFWSLSVEEQFYLFWPVLILVLLLVAARRGWGRRLVVGLGLAVVVTASLAYSVWATAYDPASAYFVTPTRIWELGVGGLLAVAMAGRPLNPRGPGRALVNLGLAWVGLVAMVVSAFIYTADTPFPGWRALLPVLGTVAVIAAADPRGPVSPGRLLERRPLQFLGDISYSVYLWHWPLVVLAPYAMGGALSWWAKVGIAGLTVLLAWASKTLVEDRFRRAPPGAPLRRSFQLAAAGMAGVLLLGGLQLAEVRLTEVTARQRLDRMLADPGRCFGAAALASGEAECPRQTSGPVVPAPAQAADDRSAAYERNCFEEAPFTGLRKCVFGDPNGTVSIAVVGNSHMGHWLPALEQLAEQNSWRLTTFLASECTFSAEPVGWDATVKRDGCLGWAERVRRATAGDDFDLVVASVRNGRAAEGLAYADSYPVWLSGYRQALGEWTAADQPVLVIHDTATPGATMGSVPDCVAANPDDFSVCGGPADRWIPRDPLAEAAAELNDADVTVVDLNDRICAPSTCDAVVGGVLVYFDASHLTATYSRTLAPYLAPALGAAVDRAR